jgi:hypothetical protein
MTCCSDVVDLSHTIGSRLFFSVTTEEGDDLTAIPIAAVLDSPDGETRHVLGYLNDYTDGTLSGDGETVELEKSAEWSAENMTPGVWEIRFLKGTADVDLVVIYEGVLNVIEPAYGAIDL